MRSKITVNRECRIGEIDDRLFGVFAAAKGCKVEYIFRDMLSVHGNWSKVKRAVEIVREEN